MRTIELFPVQSHGKIVYEAQGEKSDAEFYSNVIDPLLARLDKMIEDEEFNILSFPEEGTV